MDKNYERNHRNEKWSLVENQRDIDEIVEIFGSGYKNVDVCDRTEDTGRPAAVKVILDDMGDYTPTIYVEGFTIKDAQELIESQKIQRMWRE